MPHRLRETLSQACRSCKTFHAHTQPLITHRWPLATNHSPRSSRRHASPSAARWGRGAAQTGEQIVLLVGRGHACLGATEALDAEVVLNQVVGQEQKGTVSPDLRAVGAQGVELTLHVRVYVDQGRHHVVGRAPLWGLW